MSRRSENALQRKKFLCPETSSAPGLTPHATQSPLLARAGDGGAHGQDGMQGALPAGRGTPALGVVTPGLDATVRLGRNFVKHRFE